MNANQVSDAIRSLKDISRFCARIIELTPEKNKMEEIWETRTTVEAIAYNVLCLIDALLLLPKEALGELPAANVGFMKRVQWHMMMGADNLERTIMRRVLYECVPTINEAATQQLEFIQSGKKPTRRMNLQ